MKFMSITLLCSLLSAVPLSFKNTPYFDPNASLNIALFYTSWCPPCKRSLTLMDDMAKAHPKLHITKINVENARALKVAKTFGLTENVPYILIADHSGAVVKRFQAIPNQRILEALIQRLEEGRLENGTLPAEQRIDTWKQNRKGM
jgi:thiol-disulfide isomerase/thioredoxin